MRKETPRGAVTKITEKKNVIIKVTQKVLDKNGIRILHPASILLPMLALHDIFHLPKQAKKQRKDAQRSLHHLCLDMCGSWAQHPVGIAQSKS